MFGSKTKTYGATTSWQTDGRKHACRAEGTIVKKGKRVGLVLMTLDLDREKPLSELGEDMRREVEAAALAALAVVVRSSHPDLERA